jgi:hypothetical protein
MLTFLFLFSFVGSSFQLYFLPGQFNNKTTTIFSLYFYLFIDANDLIGSFSILDAAQSNGHSSCVLAGSRTISISNVVFNDSSTRLNGTFLASTYLASWSGRFSVVGPAISVQMRVFNNTRCTGSFARVSAQDSALLDFTCAFLREDAFETIDSTCKVTYVSNDFHYYLIMLLWNIAATVGCVAAVFFAAYTATTRRTAIRQSVTAALRHQQLSGYRNGGININGDDGSEDNTPAAPQRRRRPVVAVAASSSAADERTRLRSTIESNEQ